MSQDYFYEEERLGKAYDARLTRRLLRYLRPYRRLFALTLALGLVLMGLELAMPYITKLAIDLYMEPATGAQIAREAALRGIGLLALAYLGILGARFLLSFGQMYLSQYTGQRVMFDLRKEIFEHVLRLPARFFDRNPVGRLVTRATNDVVAINEMYTSVLVNLLRDGFLLVGTVAIMFQLNARLALLILLFAPAVGFTALVFRIKARAAYRAVRRRIAQLNAFLQEAISGMWIIQLFNQERRSREQFGEINRAKYEADMRQLNVYAIFNPLISLMQSLALALLLWYGGGGVIRGTFTLGALVAFINYVRMLFQPLIELAEKYNIMQGAMAAAEKIFTLLDKPEEEHGRLEPPAGGRGEVEFRHVWFAYKDEEWVLRDISFRVRPGERVALVGPTGSGKTTIINLLLRLYEPQRGQILIDGVDIRELDSAALRARMAVVLQDVFIFSGDVLGNIRLWNEGLPAERAIEAAKFVQAHRFISELPAGYETELGERGATLSVGQRQLLAFARAVAFNPRILILDEATANIDSQTERLIQEALEKIMDGRTSIAIAHRLSTIRDADKILVLSRGRIVEQGTHEELLRRQGLYYALYSLQARAAAGEV
ncbi:MAG: ABC transporter ATP-binding protein/permease [Candidatus Acetothermia bacterium]|jgi:ATP-binding cassette subfamily B protein|nr:ABC transporter ATP-binding protein/permease [Candidatus Acetothermia bacterium]MDH7505064.1 ABC transporter ATP-binding protein [Candidatus Acetothermia bacterium]